MRLDIENKILIPFLIIVLLIIIVLGAVSYWNGYMILSDNQRKNIEEHLEGTIHFINEINSLIEDGFISMETGRKKVLDYLSKQKKSGMILLENNDIILDTSGYKAYFEKNIGSDIEKDNKIASGGMIVKGDWYFIYKQYDKWNWKIGFLIKKNILSDELLFIQKNILLITIITLIFSMQFTILIAHNISKPIKLLADICDKIAQGNFKEKIYINRKDEIGILAAAFQNMINELKANTKKLLEMKNFNEDILRNVSAGIITIDKDGKVVSVNEAAKKILKFNPMNEKKESLIYESILNQLKDTLKTQKAINDVNVFNNERDGSKLYLDITTSLLKTENNLVIGAISSFNDITSRKKIENKIDRINRLASLGQLAAGLAHEIRNPLAGMKMSIQVLKNRLCKKDYSQSNLKLFDATLYEIDRLNNLISNLLDFARPHNPKYEPVNIIDILNKSLHLITKAAKEKKIKINLNTCTKYVRVFVDKAQIEQVFLNILTNAINAMNLNGVLNIGIVTVDTEKGNYVMIEFYDNGCGIPEENLEKIFDPFYTTSPNGTGLGLSVVHKLVTDNNGEIDIESQINAGTKFRVKFPLYSGDVNEEKSACD